MFGGAHASSTRQMTWRLRVGGGAVHNIKRRMAMNVTDALLGKQTYHRCG